MFFMPWFFFKAGIFYKQEEIDKVCKAGYKRLLIPYIVWGGWGFITHYLQPFVAGDISVSYAFLTGLKTIVLSGKIVGNSAIWFLLSLFMVRLLWHFLVKIDRIIVVVITIVITTVIIISIKQDCSAMLYPEYLYNTFLGLTFFSIGALLKESQNHKILFCTSVIVYLLLLLSNPSRVDFFHSKLIEGNVAMWMIQSLCGIFIINNLSKKCLAYTGFLQYVGKNAMVYLVTHFVIANVTRLLVAPLCIANQKMSIIYIFSILLFTPIAVKSFNKENNKWIIGL